MVKYNPYLYKFQICFTEMNVVNKNYKILNLVQDEISRTLSFQSFQTLQSFHQYQRQNLISIILVK